MAVPAAAAAGAAADSAFIQWMKGADPIEQQPEFWKAIEKAHFLLLPFRPRMRMHAGSD